MMFQSVLVFYLKMECKMKCKGILIACLVLMTSSGLVHALESKGFNIEFNKPIVQPENLPMDVAQQSVEVADIKIVALAYNINNILIYDYGGDIDLQVNSTNLAYRESNVLLVNFAKMQNQNFERWQNAS